MNHQRQHGCTKRRFRDPREAKRALTQAKRRSARELQEQGESRRRELRWYACPRCHGFHLTSQELVNESLEVISHKEVARVR